MSVLCTTPITRLASSATRKDCASVIVTVAATALCKNETYHDKNQLGSGTVSNLPAQPLPGAGQLQTVDLFCQCRLRRFLNWRQECDTDVIAVLVRPAVGDLSQDVRINIFTPSIVKIKSNTDLLSAFQPKRRRDSHSSDTDIKGVARHN